MNLPKQIHLVLDNGNYRLSAITPIGWHPASSHEENSSYLAQPDLLLELLTRLLYGEPNER